MTNTDTTTPATETAAARGIRLANACFDESPAARGVRLANECFEVQA